MDNYIYESRLGAESYDSDLAMERKKASTYVEGVDYKRETSIGGVWERLKVTSEAGEKNIGRPRGLYDTLTVPYLDGIMPEDVEDAKDEVARELCRMCDLCDISPSRVLVVGLGNGEVTPDSVGRIAARVVEPTLHIKEMDHELFMSLCSSEICTITPDVTANTGMSSCETVRGVVNYLKPSLVIAVDSLASRSSERLGNTVQISNTGVFPGTGIGHGTEALNEETLGVPVIAIGVPTVISARGLGIMDRARCGRDMFVCPKGIDKIVKNAGEIIGGGINQAFGICYL